MTSVSKVLVVIRAALHLQKLRGQLIGEESWTVGELQKFLPFSKSTTQKTLKMMREAGLIHYAEMPYKNTVRFSYRVPMLVAEQWLEGEIL